jgi:hypothetical protein
MSYIARYKDELGMIHTRRFYASHLTNAHRKASGIAKSHGWKIVSVGSL